ncbi:hypothetical protein CC86DRAFT_397517 [Ophiobolus disseminans]|uniref:F-box domain-containing protein n=1 Tax=Ophiobolus disseminans TaxID=1469910 RepID=A0A6A6ZIV6_9PLEO|nr:hypothetical protein CC86DRAFT_397517 [Ophiobolus disseminans]
MRESSCRSLPPEIWISILSFHTDLAHLWNTCRRVSSTLRACVEYAFAEHFISDIHIDFQLEKYNLGGKSKRPEIPVTFDRLGKGGDKHIAWFSDTRPVNTVCDGGGKKSQEQYVTIMQRWDENVRVSRPEMPNYTINIHGIVNDTTLPGLEIDVHQRAIQFEWRKMLQLFYREHERLHYLKDVWHTKTAKQIRANNARLAKGEKLMPSDFPQPWSSAEAELRKQVRRARLKESYCDDERMLWALDSLKHFEQYGSASGNATTLKLDPDLPGAGLGEKWFGSLNLVQELYLDEWSCMHRIDTKIHHLLAASLSN